MKTDIVQLSYKDLKTTNSKLANVLDEHKVEFTLDPKTGEYVALLNLKRERSKTPRKLKTYSLSTHRIKTKEQQTIYTQDTLKRRPFIGYSKRISVKSIEQENNRKLNKSVSVNAMKTYIIINETKQSILKEYQHLFPELDFYNMKSAPILIGLKQLLKKIELFYNKQFEALLRVKSLTALNLAHVIVNFYEPKYRDSKAYFTQIVADFVYTIYKYRNIDEIGLFLSFLTNKHDHGSFLFYLYFRQNFKFITFNYFLNHKATEVNPNELSITKEKALEVIANALYFSVDAAEEVKTHLLNVMKKKRIIRYYDFLLTCLKANIAHEGLDLMSRCLALYNFKNNSDPYEIEKESKINSSTTYFYHKKEVKTLLFDSKLEKAKQISRKARQNNIDYDKIIDEIDAEIKINVNESKQFKNEEHDQPYNLGSKHGKRINEADNSHNIFGNEEEQDTNKLNIDSKHVYFDPKFSKLSSKEYKIQNEIKQNSKEDTQYYKSLSIAASELITKQFESKHHSETTQLNKTLKDTLKFHIQKYIDCFCLNNNVKIKDIDVLKQTCFEMFYAKALRVLSMIFTGNKDKFFELIRVQPEKDQHATVFWNEITMIYNDYQEHEEKLTYHDMNAFTVWLLDFNHMRKDIDYLLTYQFSLTEDAIEKAKNERKDESNKQDKHISDADTFKTKANASEFQLLQSEHRESISRHKTHAFGTNRAN